jgi:ADP-ribose pyrophosphatase
MRVLLLGSTDERGPARDKPEGARLGWTVLETTYPFHTQWMTLRQDRVGIAGQGEITYTYVEATPAVFVVPVTASGEVVMIRQYRYPIDAWSLEIPAGGTYDFPGVPLAEVARTELREEIGGVCGAVYPVGMFYSWLAKSKQESHVFLALGVELTEQPSPQVTERIELCIMPARTALGMARRGDVADGQAALSLLLCEPLLQKHGLAG